MNKGRKAMASMKFGSLPRENPCAQCGQPIALPEWIEREPSRTFYLWRCLACDYRFEAIAYFEESEQSDEALAA
jgi:ribosomal protein L37AE/L43A